MDYWLALFVPGFAGLALIYLALIVGGSFARVVRWFDQWT